MKVKVRSSGYSSVRIVIALLLCAAGALLGRFSLSPSPVPRRFGPMLAISKLEFDARGRPHGGPIYNNIAAMASIPNPNAPTFAHPVIAGIGGTGFEESMRIDPTLNANGEHTVYTSAPGSLASDTSWIWHSLDGGKTFKWVVGAAPLEGKVTTCFGGGDTETGVDSTGHLYFADLTLANFSTSRSADHGATFTCSNTGVPDAVVDRHWY